MGKETTLVYLTSGGNKQVVKSGGEIEVQSGGTLDIQSGATLNLHGSAMSATELGFIDGVTAGTAAASKAVVLGASKEIATITTATITTLNGTTGNITTVNATNVDAGASGTAGSVDVFPTTASKGKLTLACTDQTGDTAVIVNANAMGQATTVNIADPGAAASYVVQTKAATSDMIAGAKHTVTAAEASAGTLDIVTGLNSVAAWNVQVYDTGNNVITSDADVTEATGTLTVANGAVFAVTENYVIHWMAVGS